MPSYSIKISNIERQKLSKLKLNEDDAEIRQLSLDAYIQHRTRQQLRFVTLEDPFAQAVRAATMKRLGRVWFENYAMNIAKGYLFDVEEWIEEINRDAVVNAAELEDANGMPRLSDPLKEKTTISAIPKRKGIPSIVVAAGPSVREHKHVELLAKYDYEGVVLATDRMLRPLLEAGVSPANGYDVIVASVDGHRTLIPKFYEGLDAEGVIGMLCTTIAPQTVQAALDAGVKPYWFHGLMDDFYSNDSVVGAQNWMMKGPGISAGGNVGATCWTLSVYLWCNPIAFIGLDLGYTPDTKIEQTAYYDRFIKSAENPAQLMAAYNRGYNPDWGVEYVQDPVFAHYKQSFIALLEGQKLDVQFQNTPANYEVTTINCTEGGSVHHPTLIKAMPFKDFLEEHQTQ